jgi:hypothetical protein
LLWFSYKHQHHTTRKSEKSTNSQQINFGDHCIFARSFPREFTELEWLGSPQETRNRNEFPASAQSFWSSRNTLLVVSYTCPSKRLGGSVFQDPLHVEHNRSLLRFCQTVSHHLQFSLFVCANFCFRTGVGIFCAFLCKKLVPLVVYVQAVCLQSHL